jgi:hypothetical protein
MEDWLNKEDVKKVTTVHKAIKNTGKTIKELNS